MSGDMIEGLCSDFDLNEAPGQVYKRWKQIGPLDTVQAEHPADEEIQPGHLRCIVSGWGFRQAVLRDGRRIVRNFLIPGDVIGHRKDTWPRAFREVVAATEITCATVDERTLQRDPELKAKLRQHLKAVLVTDTALLNGVVLRLGGMTVPERVVHLFLELLERHHHAELTDGNAFPLPISQDLLADSLGISRVHLNRTLQQLRQEGLISLENGRLELRRLPELIRMVDYESLYGDSSFGGEAARSEQVGAIR